MIAQLVDVRKNYGTRAALDGVTLGIARGELVALLGANGAGKTTTLEILLGLRRQDSGTVQLAAASTGVTPQETGMPQNLRVGEILEFVVSHYRTNRAQEVLEAFGLSASVKRQTGALSGGQLRRLALALAFAGEPELVVLDEPTTGLDVEARRSAWSYVRSYVQRGGTVLLTTHHMEEAEALADRILVMSAGRIVHEGTPAQIRRSVTAKRVTYEGAPFDPAAYGIEAVVESNGSRVTILTPETDELVRAMVLNGVKFAELAVSEASLEDAVLALTAGPQ